MAGGVFVFDSTTAKELDVCLERSGRLHLRGFLKDAPFDTRVPTYDHDSLGDVLSVFKDDEVVDVVIIFSGPTDRDREIAARLEAKLKAVDIAVMTAGDVDTPKAR